jgi:hypothetical protein
VTPAWVAMKILIEPMTIDHYEEVIAFWKNMKMLKDIIDYRGDC